MPCGKIKKDEFREIDGDLILYGLTDKSVPFDEWIKTKKDFITNLQKNLYNFISDVPRENIQSNFAPRPANIDTSAVNQNAVTNNFDIVINGVNLPAAELESRLVENILDGLKTALKANAPVL